jgi:RNA polymerase sigma-70 factor (ECF subfamily)
MDGTELLDRKILIQQIDKFLREATVGRGSKRDLTIFWLYYRVGLTASAIASLPCVALSTKGVESILHRLTALVRECLVKNGEPGVIQKDSPSNQRS